MAAATGTFPAPLRIPHRERARERRDARGELRRRKRSGERRGRFCVALTISLAAPHTASAFNPSMNVS
jgi:hypothetical protein